MSNFFPNSRKPLITAHGNTTFTKHGNAADFSGIQIFSTKLAVNAFLVVFGSYEHVRHRVCVVSNIARHVLLKLLMG